MNVYVNFPEEIIQISIQICFTSELLKASTVGKSRKRLCTAQRLYNMSQQKNQSCKVILK
jgi:hypothetical protein